MKKHKRKELGLTSLILLGAGFALATVTATAFLLALISSFTKNPTALTGILSLIALLLSGAISGYVTSRVNGEGGALIGILSTVVSALLILTVGLIWRGGSLNLGMPLNLLAFIGISVLFSILGKKRIKRGHKRYF